MLKKPREANRFINGFQKIRGGLYSAWTHLLNQCDLVLTLHGFYEEYTGLKKARLFLDSFLKCIVFFTKSHNTSLSYYLL